MGKTRVAVSGALLYAKAELVEWYLDRLLAVCRKDCRTMVVAEGGLSGVDAMARAWALRHAGTVEHQQFPPDWRTFGPEAFLIANQVMFDVQRPDVVVVFHDELRASPRARDLLRRARTANVPNYLVTEGLPVPYRIVDPLPDPSTQLALFDPTAN
jgi:hypothetical protein